MSGSRQDVHGEAMELAHDIYELLFGMPSDGLTVGYLLSSETRADLQCALPLLRDAYHLLRKAEEREDPIYDAYCTVHGGEGVLQ